MSTNITEEHKRFFEAISSGVYENFILVHTTFDGEPTAAIGTVTNEPDGQILLTPVCVFLTEAMFTRLSDPAEGLEDAPPAGD